jgi:hypothetical protein
VPPLLVGAGAALAAIVLLAVLVAGRPTRLPPPPRPVREQRRRAVPPPPLDPASERDPRRAILAAYAAMERAVREQGVTVAASDAPRELLARIVAGHPALAPPANRLTRVYERARFGAEPVGAEDRREALAALRALAGGG